MTITESPHWIIEEARPMGGSVEFQLATTERDGVPLVVASGEIDLATSPSLREALAALADNRPRLVLLDLSEVTFLDSTGMSVLVVFHKHFRELGGELRIVVGDPRVKKVVELVALDQVLILHDSIEDALASAHTPPPEPDALAG